NQANTKAAIIYENGEALISVPLFNSLDLENQAGILIHETLRRVQITYAGGGTDQQLQDITRAMVSGSTSLALDKSSFFRSLVGIDEAVLSKVAELCANTRARRVPVELKAKFATFCSSDLVSLNETQVSLSNLTDETENEIGRSTVAADVQELLRVMMDVNHVITVVGSKAFHRQTVAISTDLIQALQTSYVSVIIDQIRKVNSGERRLSRSEERKLKAQLEQMRQMIERRVTSTN
ncbi:MAG: hypothetical protein AAB250_09195, partial [Bdellovibrionota bacterium]